MKKKLLVIVLNGILASFCIKEFFLAKKEQTCTLVLFITIYVYTLC